MKILLVGNEAIIVQDIQRVMESVDEYTITIVQTVDEAITKAREINPDIVIMDIYLNEDIDSTLVAKEINEFCNATVMFYSTIREMQTMQDIQSVTNGSIINSNKLNDNIESKIEL